tara:strand:- start:2742 stop:3629 length:888 start_codon:yes stop_codon:yes gene_type:complete
MKNSYDNLQFSLENLTKKLELEKIKKKKFFPNFIKKYIDGFFIYTKIYRKLISSGLKDEWFEEFNYFWKNYLNGRPLYFNDFSYLLGVYRQKFQNISVKDNPDKKNFLAPWQSSESLYLLFGAVRKYAYEPFSFFNIDKYLTNKTKFLEYGCGIAPISYSILNYSSKKPEIYYADILQINSIYAQYRLKSRAKFIKLEPENYNLNLPNDFDVITINTVLEHLTDPLDCIKYLTSILKKGGLLIFDYIISEGTGLDTIEALNQRSAVIEFISKNFLVLKGSLNYDKSINIVVVKKK